MKENLQIPEQVIRWQFDGKQGNLASQNRYRGGDGYSLFCKDNRQFLTYASARFGINLGYIGNRNERKVFLQLSDRAEREIRTGDLVAIGIGGDPSFLRYANRTIGINLEYSSRPSFEWRIFGASGEMGKPIGMGEAVAIVNVNVKPDPDFLIYFKRPAGADVGWTTSPGWLGRFRMAFEMAQKAAKIIKML